jgi:hypothetical protein
MARQKRTVRPAVYEQRTLSILTKHGDQARKGQRKYFCLIHERAAKTPKGQELDWRNIMEKLFNVWRDNSLGLWAWFFFVTVLGIIIYLSVS